jgi:transcriptional regulator with XRE-family HTH domain
MATEALSNQEILRKLGRNLRLRRLSQNMTQVELAAQGGVDPGVLRKIEAGKGYTISAFIGVMRALRLLDDLVAAIPEPGPSPIDMLKHRGHERERATGRRKEQ